MVTQFQIQLKKKQQQQGNAHFPRDRFVLASYTGVLGLTPSFCCRLLVADWPSVGQNILYVLILEYRIKSRIKQEQVSERNYFLPLAWR